MRITFALPELSNLSGGLRVVAQYTRHLLEQGHEISFVVRRPRHAPGWKRRLLNLAGLGRPTPPLDPERGHFKGIDVPVIHLDEAKARAAAECARCRRHHLDLVDDGGMGGQPAAFQGPAYPFHSEL